MMNKIYKIKNKWKINLSTDKAYNIVDQIRKKLFKLKKIKHKSKKSCKEIIKLSIYHSLSTKINLKIKYKLLKPMKNQRN